MRSFLSLLAVVFLLINAQMIVAVEPAAEATPDPAFTPITRNSDWTPVERDFDGVTMVLVPAGCFNMGSDDGGSDERPVHEQCFDQPFWMDKTEVTQAQFRRLSGTQANPPNFSGDDRPVENITWFEARDFCALRGARLPTEREWEYAARGPESWVYPWGEPWEQSRVIGFRDSSQGTADVGSIPTGASWVGAMDMSGNVWEWVADWYGENYHGTLADDMVDLQDPLEEVYRVRRGGSWVSSDPDYFRTSYRFKNNPIFGNYNNGFRCARDYDDAAADTTEIAPESTVHPGQGSSITRNSDWTPVEREFDGVLMVLVPAGCFNMGSDIDMGIDYGFNDERPIHEICLDEPFWIDKYEVTQAQFQRLGGIQATAPGFLGDERPLVNITWFEARGFCELRDSRLPTEAEWEYTARGPESWVYPWGDAWDENNVVWNRSGAQGTENVGSIPAGASWVGALDMSGNVWEWTSTLYDGYPYDAADGREQDTGSSTDVLRVLRGGSWDGYGPVFPRASLRFGFFPLDAGVNIGLRCARAYE